jgi:N-acetylmuramoyl-L-alanine amidase
MKSFRLISFCIVSLSLAFGCHTTKQVQNTALDLMSTKPAVEKKVLVIEQNRSLPAQAQEQTIEDGIRKASAAQYHAIIYFGDEGRMKFAKELATSLNMRFYSGLNLQPLLEQSESQPASALSNALREFIRNQVTNFEMDGFCLPVSGLSLDQIEEMAVEAMLLKPYVLVSLAFANPSEQSLAAQALKEGIADFIFPANTENPQNRTYPELVTVPALGKKIKPEQVISLDLSSIITGEKKEQTVKVNGVKTKITNPEGIIGFINRTADSILLELQGKSFTLRTREWMLPFIYAMQPDGKVQRKAPWLEFRRLPSMTTSLPGFDFLCKTDYPATVSIGGETVKQYKTGIFFKRVNFIEGVNRVRATATMPDTRTIFYEPEFLFQSQNDKRNAFPLWINETSIQPAYDLELQPDDVIRFSFEGSLAQNGTIELKNAGLIFPCERTDRDDYSIYQAEIQLSRLPIGIAQQLTLRLAPADGKSTSLLTLPIRSRILVKQPKDFPMVKIVKDNSRLTYNLGAPRLGGPIRAELGPGILFKSNGKFGDNIRVRLNEVEDGILAASDVEIMPSHTAKPGFTISSLSCGPSENADIVTIPYPEPVPYEVIAEPEQKRVIVTLFGVETSSTWITHRNGRKVIDKVTWKQTTPETYQIIVHLNTSKIWGYELKREGQRLVMRFRYPPTYDLNTKKPLSGIKISIEAGHGGSNTGAVGLSGILEKDINLDLSLRLGELCKAKGADIFQVREVDKDIALLEKRDLAIGSNAHLHLSIHANSGGGGYLRVSGTSTYYHNPFWAPFAEEVYKKLLELPLEEFGVVGSFNYTVTRMTQMPSILVEQAFLSHAEDEEKMADDAFRQQMAQKILDGILEYLRMMQD